jgi:hypothetical protein
MCKKLMFLISLVCLLGMASPLLAANLEVDWPDVYVVSGTEEYDEVGGSGKIIVPSGATLIMNDESDLDGNGDDGCGGDGASIIVDGGTFIMHNRLNMGKDHDAYLIVDNGGTVQHDGDKVTCPDDPGGQHRIIIIDGSMVAEEIEIIPDRDAAVVLGCNATIQTCNTDDDSRRPSWWVTQDVSGGCGTGKALQCYSGCAGVLTITDLGGDCEEATCLLLEPPAWNPGPRDGATGEAAVTCDMVLSWNVGSCITDFHGRNFVYFSTDVTCVETAPAILRAPAPLPGDPPCYLGRTNWDVTTFNVGQLPLWTKYYWRIDQGCSDASVVKGYIWSFTTGCPMIPGDANLDCLVNFLDYAEVASTWMGQQYFPEGCTP